MGSEERSRTVTLSEERVKNLLYEMKDKLLDDLEDKFARKADLVMLTDARKEIIRQSERIASLERWRSYVVGAAAVAVLLAGAAVSLVAAYLT